MLLIEDNLKASCSLWTDLVITGGQILYRIEQFSTELKLSNFSSTGEFPGVSLSALYGAFSNFSTIFSTKKFVHLCSVKIHC